LTLSPQWYFSKNKYYEAPWGPPRSRDSSVVQRWVTDWMIGGSSPGSNWNFSLHHRVQTGSGSHSASYQIFTRSSFSGGKKLPRSEADHSPQSSAEVKECVELYLTSPIRLHSMMLSYKKVKRQLYLYLLPGAHPASYPMGNRDSFPGDKAAGAWSWSLTSIQCWGQECVQLYSTPRIRVAWCLVKHRDNFKFTSLYSSAPS
jgi:hypothetical protein